MTTPKQIRVGKRTLIVDSVKNVDGFVDIAAHYKPKRKRIKPLLVSCPTCNVAAHSPCKRKPARQYHVSRKEKAHVTRAY